MKFYVISSYFFVLLTKIVHCSVNDQQCSDAYPRCVFIVAVGLSGSTTLMDVLNQHPEIHIRGENSGIFNQIHQIMHNHLAWNQDYEQLFADENWKLMATFQTHTYQHAYQGIKQMFKYLYGHDDNWGKMIGFKEIRFIKKEQIDFVRGLCDSSKIIFQYSDDIEKISHRLWFNNRPDAFSEIKDMISLFNEYHEQNPNNTFISTVKDFKSEDFVQRIFDFLELSLEGVEIDVGRLFRNEMAVRKANQQQMQQKKQQQLLQKQKNQELLRQKQKNKQNVKQQKQQLQQKLQNGANQDKKQSQNEVQYKQQNGSDNLQQNKETQIQQTKQNQQQKQKSVQQKQIKEKNVTKNESKIFQENQL
eukprot:TRINITY_DN1506_c0_g1_i1.p1 TRINITY_DN1506_c0_g1~~TRINITY_DN1506_c0_g1_i1.p1  ORF type:complete len:361 (-),score=36.06 TRINITY_DN1506_c0_g1_i1:340-1422(-)